MLPDPGARNPAGPELPLQAPGLTGSREGFALQNYYGGTVYNGKTAERRRLEEKRSSVRGSTATTSGSPGVPPGQMQVVGPGSPT